MIIDKEDFELAKEELLSKYPEDVTIKDLISYCDKMEETMLKCMRQRDFVLNTAQTILIKNHIDVNLSEECIEANGGNK